MKLAHNMLISSRKMLSSGGSVTQTKEKKMQKSILQKDGAIFLSRDNKRHPWLFCPGTCDRYQGIYCIPFK